MLRIFIVQLPNPPPKQTRTNFHLPFEKNFPHPHQSFSNMIIKKSGGFTFCCKLAIFVTTDCVFFRWLAGRYLSLHVPPTSLATSTSILRQLEFDLEQFEFGGDSVARGWWTFHVFHGIDHWNLEGIGWKGSHGAKEARFPSLALDFLFSTENRYKKFLSF